MARRPRVFPPNVPLHVVQRGNNRGAIFRDTEDRLQFLDYLVDAADEFRTHVHCYVLMTNHVHLLMTAAVPDRLSGTLQRVGVRYVRHYNDKYERTGGLFEGRYRHCIVDSDRYLQACYRYIEMNPVRAGLCDAPTRYRWSSHRFHALGAPDRLVAPHPHYHRLADSDPARQARYREWFDQPLRDDELESIRESTRRGLAFGGEDFKQRLERLGIPARPPTRGRPKKGV